MFLCARHWANKQEKIIEIIRHALYTGHALCIRHPFHIGFYLMQNILDHTYPQFFKSEASAKSNFGVVLECWTSDNWPKVSNWSGWYLSSFLLSGYSSSLLSSRLVKPCFYVVLPVFMKMAIRNYVVVLHSKGIKRQFYVMLFAERFGIATIL